MEQLPPQGGDNPEPAPFEHEPQLDPALGQHPPGLAGTAPGSSAESSQPDVTLGTEQNALAQAAEAGYRPGERRTNKQILRAARAGIEMVADHTRDRENIPGVRELAEYCLTADSAYFPASLVDRAVLASNVSRSEVLASARDSAVFRLWSRSKVVYAMDDLLLNYLSESSTSQVPTDILRNLPHRDPYILLPEPDFSDPQTDYYRTHIGLPIGAFVFGRHNQARQMCSTADEQREDLGLMFLAFIATTVRR